jgi:hypothetical protein
MMFTKASAPVREKGSLRRIGSCLGLAWALLGAGAGCEDKAIGRPCSIDFDASAGQGVYNTNASECPSRICVKPSVQPGVANSLDTGAYCSVECNSDGDCQGQERDPNNSADLRCRKGFTCAPIFNKGPLCCKKLCLCRDFYLSSVGPATPDACNPDSGVTCS